MRDLILTKYPALYGFYVVCRACLACLGLYTLWLGCGSFLRGDFATGWGIASTSTAALIWWISVGFFITTGIYNIGRNWINREAEETEPDYEYVIQESGQVVYDPDYELSRLQNAKGDYFYWNNELKKFNGKRFRKGPNAAKWDKIRSLCLSKQQKAAKTYKKEVKIGQTIQL